jgi:predicted ABC-type transport system involved in lysophospholipase L1 biosynthesis ATPase subunit
MKSKIVINGVTYEGDNVIIKNGVIQIDNNNLNINEKEIHINILGDIEKLKIDCCDDINIIGNVKEFKNGSGDVKCGDVECQNISGDVKTSSGDVTTKHVSGDVTTGSGDVIYN